MSVPDKDTLVQLIREAIERADRTWISRRQFLSQSGLKDSDVFRHFASWSEAVAATGLELRPANQKIPTGDLLMDWADVVRRRRGIPTRKQYRLEGSYSPGVLESRFGPWSAIPSKFREFAQEKSEWSDVLALLPPESSDRRAFEHASNKLQPEATSSSARPPGRWHAAFPNRPTYGEPINFRGLRHAPVNENGVVFVFGMVAKELGYLVEAIQIGFPDCEAKRRVSPHNWQSVRIEFEFESRNFLDHGHSADECDVLVCWRHNWRDAPEGLEIVELQSVIRTLAKSDE